MTRKQHNVKGLYYITHINNVSSMLEHGILSHAIIEERNIPYTPIYDAQIVTNRREKVTPSGNSLWNFANLYFQVRNPMLYRVISEKNKNEIAILGVNPVVLNYSNAFVSTGNAASGPSEILPVEEGMNEIAKIWHIITSEWWNSEDGSKRKIMAECLVPQDIPPDLIHTIFVANHQAAEGLRAILPETKVPIVPEPEMFFQPKRNMRIANNISLVEGDMFFSQQQTLTISVNTVGVMGKGLASRAKYQFPDVYVYYQDACRQKTLQMGRPVVYKREASLDSELADDPSSFPNPNANKWFLLFATKRHWKEGSDLAGIEEGLAWLAANYKREGIQSLAVPALGCGLGGLDWRDVGPLMCRYLIQMDIHTSIYLPREQALTNDLLTKDFLLGQR